MAPRWSLASGERCSQCGIPYCQIHCPLANNIPDWLRLTAEGRLREAWEVSNSTNWFPEICGRICPQDRLCEGNCVIEQAGHGTVTIGAIEKYLTETAWQENWIHPIRPRRELDVSVGIIGAGPAGLACGLELRKQGFQVVIYDAYDRAGGLLVYGIPNFKLEKEVVQRRIQWTEASGIRYQLNQRVGRDIAFQTIRERHQAVLVATGVYQARQLEGLDLPRRGFTEALPFLTAATRQHLGDALSPDEKASLQVAGQHVVVLGGGDTAMDCVRTAVRLGAAKVQCLYRRDRDNMPGSQNEVHHAIEEGVEFLWMALPSRLLVSPKGVLYGLMYDRTRMSAPGPDGRHLVQAVPGSETQIPSQRLIAALGFECEDLSRMFSEPSLARTSRGTVQVDPRSMRTNLERVYAAGDSVRGASLVVWAIRDGVDAAQAITRDLLRTPHKKVA